MVWWRWRRRGFGLWKPHARFGGVRRWRNVCRVCVCAVCVCVCAVTLTVTGADFKRDHMLVAGTGRREERRRVPRVVQDALLKRRERTEGVRRQLRAIKIEMVVPEPKDKHRCSCDAPLAADAARESKVRGTKQDVVGRLRQSGARFHRDPLGALPVGVGVEAGRERRVRRPRRRRSFSVGPPLHTPCKGAVRR